MFSENEILLPAQADRKFLEVGALATASGGGLPSITVAYETWGELNSHGDNAILICHAISGDSHAIGWWNALIGPGKAIDTERYFVVCSNALGGCQGTTGPSSKDAFGRPFGSRFPIILMSDIVEVQHRLTEWLGIRRLYAVAGGSMGGMNALQWTVQFPEVVDRAFVTASARAHNAMQIGFNEAGRQAVMRDPKWRSGDYPLDDGPAQGLAVARMIGHLTFLSPEAFEFKFGRRLQEKPKFDFRLGVEFQVESYLAHQGDKFTSRFDANSFLYLSRAIDYFDLKSLESSRSKYLFVSFGSDWLYVPEQAEEMNAMARDAGLESTHKCIDEPMGHDAFLLDGNQQSVALRRFLAE